jgi:hypothetical protein
MMFPEFIQNWVNIENISFWELGKKFLRSMPITDCETKSLLECSVYDTCEIYKSFTTKQEKCVTKERIDTFRENVTFEDKNKKEYILLYFIYSERRPGEKSIIKDNFIKQYTDNQEKTLLYNKMNINYICYCYIIKSVLENSIYILFSSGAVLNKKSLYGPRVRAFIGNLTKFILELDDSSSQIYLCGHSMGCVFAQLTGINLIKENNEFFQSRCTVVGSAPFRWIQEIDIQYYNSNSNKFYIFVLGLNNNTIDPFFYKGDDELQQQYPINLMNINIEVTGNKMNLQVINEIIVSNPGTIGIYMEPGPVDIHNWFVYKEQFDLYFLSKKGGYKKHKKHKKYTKCKKIMKNKKIKKSIKNKKYLF